MQQSIESLYEKIDEVGTGAYGTVFKAKNKMTNEIVAIKKIKCNNEAEGLPSTTIREVSTVKALTHPNIVRFIKQYSGPTFYMVFQFVDFQVKKYLDSQGKEQGFEPLLLKSLSYQLLKGVNFVHKNNLLHRDLKPQNLLLSKNFTLKIADFGLARSFGIPIREMSCEVVTLWYRAPQLLLGANQYGPQIDVWSVGCVIAEFINNIPLFPEHTVKKELDAIFKIVGTPTQTLHPTLRNYNNWKTFQFEKYEPIKFVELFPKFDPDGLDLLQKLLDPDPKTRITAKEALSHKYFSDIQKINLPQYKNSQ